STRFEGVAVLILCDGSWISGGQAWLWPSAVFPGGAAFSSRSGGCPSEGFEVEGATGAGWSAFFPSPSRTGFSLASSQNQSPGAQSARAGSETKDDAAETAIAAQRVRTRMAPRKASRGRVGVERRGKRGTERRVAAVVIKAG